MIPSGARVWIAMGHTDMRKGMQGLALLVQQGLKRDPHGGDLFVFRGRAGLAAGDCSRRGARADPRMSDESSENCRFM
ncbi:MULTISPECIES: IS66 family insertion sequence element accessory protein TnpB [Novosphingobium]|uniref:IS66 family insertion sequence element accessory protein TnpB n=1 Tax=Novosphingobium TaxID=165696 RepID=UPI0022F25216|nr:IS66 family insertion sequence element accessory protein TnpB [Novosphingobium resinovorum]GLK42667.1 hypothetical protein GCM10017612_05840 [Novosphingobium resinovorum]